MKACGQSNEMLKENILDQSKSEEHFPTQQEGRTKKTFESVLVFTLEISLSACLYLILYHCF